MASQPWTQSVLSGVLWKDMFYTTFTTVRTAIVAPLTFLVMLIAMRVRGRRGLANVTLVDQLTNLALGSLISSAPLRPNSPVIAIFIQLGFVFAAQQFVIYLSYWTSERSPSPLVDPKPMLLVANGMPVEVIQK